MSIPLLLFLEQQMQQWMYTLSLADHKGLGATAVGARLLTSLPGKFKLVKLTQVWNPPSPTPKIPHGQKIIPRIPSPIPGKFMDQSRWFFKIYRTYAPRLIVCCEGMVIKNEKKFIMIYCIKNIRYIYN